MAQDSTAKISLTPTEAKALHRHLSNAIEYIEINPTRFLKGDKDLLADKETAKKVLGKISTALENHRKTKGA